jgi:uncharacterized protein
VAVYEADGGLVVSASDLTGFLECEHLTRLSLEVARGRRQRPTATDPMTELGEQAGHHGGEGRHRVGHHRPGRAPYAGDVEADHLPPWVQRIHEGLQHLQTGADPVHQQQRWQ